MNKKNFNFKGNRILKNDAMKIKPGNFALDPLTLNIIENTDTKDNRYFSKFYLEDNKLNNLTKNKSLKLNDNKFMLTPPILIQHNDFLSIHNINNINDLIDYLDNNSELYDYNNRILNCFIRENYNDLSKNNKILTDIYLKIFKNYKIDNKIIENFIEKWFRNNKFDSFFLNLGNDLKNFLSKKYES